jgi:hypothetical protein
MEGLQLFGVGRNIAGSGFDCYNSWGPVSGEKAQGPGKNQQTADRD